MRRPRQYSGRRHACRFVAGPGPVLAPSAAAGAGAQRISAYDPCGNSPRRPGRRNAQRIEVPDLPGPAGRAEALGRTQGAADFGPGGARVQVTLSLRTTGRGAGRYLAHHARQAHAGRRHGRAARDRGAHGRRPSGFASRSPCPHLRPHFHDDRRLACAARGRAAFRHSPPADAPGSIRAYPSADPLPARTRRGPLLGSSGHAGLRSGAFATEV
jgi:hypothetical protein